MARNSAMEEKRGRKPNRKRRMDRKDFGSFRQRLVVPAEVEQWAKRNNKELRFVNDEKARISQLIAQDWDFVEFQGGEVGTGESIQEMGNGYSTVVGTKENGEPLRGYLMAKEKDWYEEDQRLKQKEVDAIDEEIKQGALGKVENVYQPKDGAGRTITRY